MEYLKNLHDKRDTHWEDIEGIYFRDLKRILTTAASLQYHTAHNMASCRMLENIRRERK